MRPEIKTALTEYLEGLLKLIGESAEIEITHETEREISINLRGLQFLDGTDPKPLRSLSYLTEISMRRKIGKGIKVFLDANGMQGQRLANLHQLATSSAETSLRDHTRVELPPMDTQDRKLIHEYLSEFEGVKTHSEGQGDERRVIIEPLRRRSDDVQIPKPEVMNGSDQEPDNSLGSE